MSDPRPTFPSPSASHWRAALVWAALFVVATFDAAGGLIFNLRERAADVEPTTFWLVAVGTGAGICAMVALTWQLTTRYPLGRGRLRRHLPVYLLSAVVASALWSLADSSVRQWAGLPTSRLGATAPTKFLLTLGDFALFTLLCHALVMARAFLSARRRGHELRTELHDTNRRRTEAELRAFDAELNPRILDTTLGTVERLMRTDVSAADRLLAQLGVLLRSTLSRPGLRAVALWEELEQLEPYLAVERMRLHGRARIEIELPDEILDASVPEHILQPLLEHAIALGSESGGDDLVLRMSGRRAGALGERLHLVVERLGGSAALPFDVGAAASGARASVSARLTELYGPDASVVMPDDPRETTVALVDLPWHDSARPDPTTPAPRPASRIRRAVAWATRTPTNDDRRPAPDSAAPIYVVLLWLTTWVGMAHGTLRNPLPDGTYVPLPIAIIDTFFFSALQLSVVCGAFILTRRRPLVSTSAVLLHAGVSLGLGLLLAIERVIGSWVVGTFSWEIIRPHLGRSLAQFIGIVTMQMMVYGLLVLVAHGIAFGFRVRRAEAASDALDLELGAVVSRRVDAELRALRAQLKPHFIGNALHAISTLMRTDPDGASRVLDELRALLRQSSGEGPREVSLGEELTTLEPFIALERSRLGGRLEVSVNVDSSVLAGRVPHLILQPLFENAVKHGFADGRRVAHIEIAARRGPGGLEVTVSDDGAGLRAVDAAVQPEPGHGVGLTNTRARLVSLYGQAASFDLVPGDRRGAVARLRLPWTERQPA